MIRHILGKPFEWLMRLSYKMHLAIDRNSEWYCFDQDTLDIVIDDHIALITYDSIDEHIGRDGSIDFNCECDCI
jgi:hypothetical protein